MTKIVLVIVFFLLFLFLSEQVIFFLLGVGEDMKF